jgi:hypothetical protein
MALKRFIVQKGTFISRCPSSKEKIATHEREDEREWKSRHDKDIGGGMPD